MKIEIIKQVYKEDTLLDSFDNELYKLYDIEITVEEKDENGEIHQKIYYGTYLNFLFNTKIIDYNQETPERLKVAVEQMIKFL